MMNFQKSRLKSDEDRKVNFYTSMYHSFIESQLFYNDVNGEYRGLDQNIYKAERFTNYTIFFSLWDTYRALPLPLLYNYPAAENK